MRGGDPRVEGHRPGQWRNRRGRIREPVERPDQGVARLDRQEVPPARHVRRRVLHARGEVAGAGAAGRLLRAQRRVTLDPLIDLGSAVQEVPGRVDPDHHREPVGPLADRVPVPPARQIADRVPADASVHDLQRARGIAGQQQGADKGDIAVAVRRRQSIAPPAVGNAVTDEHDLLVGFEDERGVWEHAGLLAG